MPEMNEDAPEVGCTADALADVLRSLDGLIDWERRAQNDGMRGATSLEPVRDVLQRLGDPQDGLRIVHVAGTKGKGSTCALIEAGLVRAGLRAGRYGSPHVESVTERVSILGAPVGRDALALALRRAYAARVAACRDGTDGCAATWFDLLTAGGLAAFEAAGLEWAVLEVGLGGRLDSTNVVRAPDVTVITNIELEHTAVLGGTRELIAREKAGIIKPGVPVATSLAEGDPAGRVVREVAAGLGSPVYVPPRHLPTGTIEERNVALAGLALDLAGAAKAAARSQGRALGAWLLDPQAIRDARLPGRLERFVVRGIPVVLDGAHVPFNLEAVLDDLGRNPRPGQRPMMAIVAVAADKDAMGLMRVLAREAGAVMCTSLPNVDRALPAHELARLACEVGLPATVVPDRSEALSHAMAWARQAGGWVLVTGSLHLAGSFRSLVALLAAS